MTQNLHVKFAYRTLCNTLENPKASGNIPSIQPASGLEKRGHTIILKIDYISTYQKNK